MSERSGVARQSEPATSGVPLAKAHDIKSTGGLKVVDAGGKEVPAQFEVTSRWGGGPADGGLPIRWLLVDFQASVAANGSSVYHLQEGGSGDSADTGLNVVRDDTQYLEIDTGAARFRFNKASFNLFDNVSVGGNQLVSPSASSGAEVTASSGQKSSSSGAAPHEVVLETDGPMRKTVRVRGLMAGAAGNLLHYTARVSLFAGSSEARVVFTARNPLDPVEEDGQPLCYDIGCPRSAVFRDLTVGLQCAVGSGGKLRLGGEGVNGLEVSPGTLKIYQDSSGTGNWRLHRGNHPRPQSYVSFRGYKAYQNGSEVSSGNQPVPWLDYSGASGGVAVATREFWQNYPKALRGQNNRVEVALFPDEYSGDFAFRPQEQKTHDILFYFHGPGTDAGSINARAAGVNDPLFAAASTDYYLSTGAFGRVTGVSDEPEFAGYEELNRATLDGDGLNLYRVIEDAEFYSWQDYGEVPVDYEDGGTGTFNDKYNFDLGMMLQFARTGDYRWFKLAEAGARHAADLDVLHCDGRVDIWWKGGFFGNGNHDEDSNSNPNRNYIGPHPDLVFGTPGLFQLYYLTGYRPGYDTAIEITENVKYRYDNSYGRGNGEGYAESPDDENGCETARPFAHSLWVLVDAYRATGKTGYLGTAEWVITNSRKATDLFITDPVPGDKRFTKLFMWDLLELALGRYLDLCGEMGRSDSAGAREQLLEMTRQEARVIWKTDERGNKGVPYSWMRDGTPWGWEWYEVAVNVCDWHLLTADALTYGYLYGGDASLLDRAAEAFKTGSNPNLEYYRPEYTATKEATNSANFGLVYQHYRNPPGDVPSDDTGAQFHEWICLENPGDEAADVRLTYYLGDGTNSTQAVEVPARSRRTVNVNEAVGGGKDVSVTVESDRPIVAERPMYFNYHGTWPGGHCELGATGTSREWYFAEGCTRPGFEQWITLENPGDTDGLVTLTYMLEGEASRVQEVNASRGCRTTVNVNEFLGEGHDVSTMVESSVPLAAERPVYFRYRDKWSGGHDALGATSPSKTWYFAEGTTRSNEHDGVYEQWLCLQNPNGEEAHARVYFMLDGGGEIAREYAVPPTSRLTVDVNLEVGPDRDVSTRIEADQPLVVERPLYFLYRGVWEGGHDVVGALEPAREWYFAEGCTRDGFHTWLCLGNPQQEQVEATVDYYLGSGRNESRSISLPPLSRSTVDVNLDVGPGEDVSMRVTAGAPVVTE
ncbi:MAG: DUF5719 family protein, partial [Actinomycetia bacterium]|nr:DUF5719 family protein [Actinomycetes bacterium]